MKRFLFFLAAMLLSGLAFADDMVASNGRDSVRLTQQPCPIGILLTIPPELMARVKAATATIDGKNYSACWIAAGGQAILQYEDGDSGAIPLSEFKRVPSV